MKKVIYVLLALFLVIITVGEYKQIEEYLSKENLHVTTFSLSKKSVEFSADELNLFFWFSYYANFEGGIDPSKFREEYTVNISSVILSFDKDYKFKGEPINIEISTDFNKNNQELYFSLMKDKKVELTIKITDKYGRSQVGLFTKMVAIV